MAHFFIFFKKDIVIPAKSVSYIFKECPSQQVVVHREVLPAKQDQEEAKVEQLQKQKK